MTTYGTIYTYSTFMFLHLLYNTFCVYHQAYSRKLESDIKSHKEEIRSHKEDYKVLNEAFITTKQGYELKLESLNLEVIKLKQERDELQNQLEIARTEVSVHVFIQN